MNDLNHSRKPVPRARAGRFHVPFLLPVLIAGVAFMMLAGRVTAQTFRTLHSFTARSANSLGAFTNIDGASPYAGLTLSGNSLYGTATYGGSGGYGTVFKVNTDGTGFSTLYSFAGGSDGANPVGGVIVSGDTLYGTAAFGGSEGWGTVFKLKTDGTGFTTLHSFIGGFFVFVDGGVPSGGLVLSGNTLYGTTQQEGDTDQFGTVFKVNTDGTGFTNLHNFTGGDGGGPDASLILSGDTLYGTGRNGVSGVNGTVFKVNTDGTGFTNLHNFLSSNSDGYGPSGLVLSGNTLYGTASAGGIWISGTVFAINTDGTRFTNLYSFAGSSTNSSGTNSDGAFPWAGLILSSNILYGTAYGGGSSGNGTVFAVNTDGTGFSNLHNFTRGSDGGLPTAGLILAGDTLYGTTGQGGSGGGGTIFSISFRPNLTIIPSGGNVILSWPTNYAGFDFTGHTLQSTTNLASPAWITKLPAPVIVNGLSTITNPISGTQQFFRLSQ